MKWLNLTSELMQSDFAAHIGFSIAIPLFGYYVGGSLGLFIASILWIAESLIWKFIVRNHFKRLWNGLDDYNTKYNLVVNLCSRIVIPAILMIVELVK